MAGKYCFHLIDGHPPTSHRAIGFLEEIMLDGEGDSELDAKEAFDALPRSRERELRTRFDYWLSGGPPNDRWFHGWPNDQEVEDCFCFKWKERRTNHRLYGYLCNPQPKTNPRFQTCVLIYHDAKNDESTNRTILIRAMNLKENTGVRVAVSFIFPDEAKGREHIQ